MGRDQGADLGPARYKSILLLPETAAETTKRGPKAELALIPGCGHAPSLMEPDQIKIIVDWLARTPR